MKNRNRKIEKKFSSVYFITRILLSNVGFAYVYILWMTRWAYISFVVSGNLQEQQLICCLKKFELLPNQKYLFLEIKTIMRWSTLKILISKMVCNKSAFTFSFYIFDLAAFLRLFKQQFNWCFFSSPTHDNFARI